MKALYYNFRPDVGPAKTKERFMQEREAEELEELAYDRGQYQDRLLSRAKRRQRQKNTHQ